MVEVNEMYRIPISRKWSWLLVVLFVQIVLLAVPLAKAQSDADARQVLSEMLFVTETTIRQVEALKSRGYSSDRTFKESEKIANIYNQAFFRLGEQLEGLGVAGKSYAESPEGKQMMDQVNAGMKRVKQAFFEANAPVIEKDFGRIYVSDGDKIKAKYEFSANYMRGIRGLDKSTRDEMIGKRPVRGLPLWLTSIVNFEFQIMLVGKKGDRAGFQSEELAPLKVFSSVFGFVFFPDLRVDVLKR